MCHAPKLFFGAREGYAIEGAAFDGVAQAILDLEAPIGGTHDCAICNEVSAPCAPFIESNRGVDRQI